MKKTLLRFFHGILERKHEIVILYFDRASEFLMMTSERMVISEDSCTLEQVLDRLRLRGADWAYELDRRNVLCAIDGYAARRSDRIMAGCEISISSRKSVFEP